MAANDCKFFDEDEVCKKTTNGCFIYGLVCENSEYLSSDDEEDDSERLQKGTVRVAWHPTGKESIIPESQLVLADRSLMPGDVIRRFGEDQNSQRGFVQDIHSKCHIQIKGTNKYIYDVDSRDLTSMNIEELSYRSWSNNTSDVTMDSWVGKIEGLTDEITLLFPDGASCKVTDTEDLEEFEVVGEQSKEENSMYSANDIFYKGMVMKGCIGDLKSVEWIMTTSRHGPKAVKKHPQHSVTVRIEETKLKSASVYWMCRGLTKTENPLSSIHSSPPPSKVKHPDLQRLCMLDWYSHCSIQIGDKAQYTIKSHDVLSEVPPKSNCVPDILMQNPSGYSSIIQNGIAIGDDAEEKMDISDSLENQTQNKAPEECVKDESENKENLKNNDDEYEDIETSESENEGEKSHKKHTSSSRKKGRKLTKLCTGKNGPKKAKQTVRFEPPFPTCAVDEKVAVEICYTYSTATVMWQDGTVEENIPSPELFPIHHLDDLEFFPGDYVIDGKEIGTKGVEYGVVVSCNHKERTCFVKWMKTVDVAKGERPDENIEPVEVSAYDLKDHHDFKFRPSQTVIRVVETKETDENFQVVGQIHSLDPQGAINVRWPNGKITRCYPQELYIVGEEMSEFDSSSWSTEEEETEEEDSDVSWETENEEEVDPDAHENDPEDGKQQSITKEKKEELQSLLQRSQSSLESLQELFVVSGHFKITYRYLRDMISVYRKCQELDKFLKLNFFEDQEMKTVVEEIKALMYQERRNELNDHLLKIFESRKVQNREDSPVKEGSSSGLSELSCESTNSGTSTASDDIVDIMKDISDSNLAEIANEIVQSVIKTFTDSNSSHEFMSSTSSTDSESKQCDKAGKLCDNEELRANGTDSRNSTENTSATKISSETNRKSSEDLYDHKEQKLCSKSDVRDCDSGQTEFQASGSVSSETDEDVAVQKKKEEKCRKFYNLLHLWLKKMQDLVAGATICTCCVEENPNKNQNKLVEDIEEAVKPEVEDEVVVLGTKAEDSSGDMKTDIKEEMTMYKQGTSQTQGFEMCESVHSNHHFSGNLFCPVDPKSFMNAVRKEYKLLQSSLPSGIIVKGFEDRMDLFSIMVVGPKGTPYEDGLFFFDVQLPSDYPTSPPVFHYISYCSDRLNPNLYEDGKVCVSLLGTWDGKRIQRFQEHLIGREVTLPSTEDTISLLNGSEMWTNKSNMLQVLISIQGLILVAEPYYNEAGYEKQRGSMIGHENSKMYNEMAIIKLVQSMSRMIENPPHSFKEEMTVHLREHAPRILQRFQFWLNAGNVSRSKDCDTNNGRVGKMSESRVNTQATEGQVPVNCSSEQDSEENLSASTQLIESHSSSEFNIKEANTVIKPPEFPLFPPSKGFCLPMKKHLDVFRQILQTILSDDIKV